MITVKPNDISHREILVVEDNASDLKFISDVLKTAGYRVRPAGDGELALRSVRAKLPSLILLDIKLPGLSGVEVCRQLKANPETREIPVIFISALGESELKVTALEAGGVDYVTKPIDSSEVLARIHNHLTIHRLQQKLVCQSEKLIKEIEERKLVEQELNKHQMSLEDLVESRTAKLKDSEELFRAAFMGSPNAMVISVRESGVWIDANKSALDMFGYTREEAVGTSSLAMNLWVDPNDRQRVLAALDQGEEVRNREIQFRRRDGELMTASLSLRGLELKGVEHLLFIIEDITEKIMTEQRFQMLFNEMLDGFALHEIICDDHGHPVDYRFLDINPAFERLTGLSRDTLIGKTVLEVMPETEPYWIQKYGRVALTGEPDYFENYSREIDRYFEVTAFKYVKNQFACIFMDTTERRRAEEDREKLRKQLSEVVQMAHLGYWEYDVITDLFTFNDQLYNIFRTTAAEVGGYTMSSSEYAKRFFHPDDRPFVVEKIQKAMKTTDPNFRSRLEHRTIYADGSIGHMSTLFFIVKDANGNTTKMYGVKQDITELKKSDAQLRQAQKLEAIGTLAGGIAHDFNNILFPIVGYTEMLVTKFPEESKNYDRLNLILKSAMRASDLVEQILTFSRQREKEPKPLKAEIIVKEALKLMRASLPSIIEIELDIAEDCGLVMADPTEIHQIIMNLCTNAYHAMEETGGKLSVALTRVESAPEQVSSLRMHDGPYLYLKVSDNGHGIKEEVLEHIFEPYYTTKGEGKGTGLGLSVVHGIIHACGGDIRVRSKLGEGTVFQVLLPLIKTEIMEAETKSVSDIPRGHEKILIVDDEKGLIKLEEKMLGQLGYEITSYTSSPKALLAFRREPEKFDLVITDFTMPHMTGDILAAEMMKVRPDVPIILCTGHSEKISEEEAIAFGIKGFLKKPVPIRAFAEKVREILDK